MLSALGAASSALDALKSLASPKPRSDGIKQHSKSPFDFADNSASGSSPPPSGVGGGSPISPATMSALLAALGQSTTGPATPASTGRSDALKDLFSQIDVDGDRKLSKTEFENALGAGGTNVPMASDVFGKLDKDGDGTVSLNEMMSALNGKGRRHHHHAAGSQGAAGAGSGSDPLLQALQGASSSSVSNSDGSTTTSLTYADGSKVTMTSPAATTPSDAATSSYNFIEQMIQRQARAISSAGAGSLSVSA
jgi:EF-hand domain pair